MNKPPNICEKWNRLTLCVHIVLKMMQCWRKQTSHLILSQTTNVIDSTKPTEFADDNFRSDGNGINSYRQENSVGKREIPR